MIRKTAIGLGIGALAAAAVLVVAATGDLLDRYELTTYDWRMRLAADPASVNKDIVFIEINDLSIRALQDNFRMRWPWPRVAVGLAIEFLHRAPAKVVAVDIAFPEHDYVEQYSFDDPHDKWSGSDSDANLSQNVRTSGNVVLLADAVYEGQVGSATDREAGASRAPTTRSWSRPRPRSLRSRWSSSSSSPGEWSCRWAPARCSS